MGVCCEAFVVEGAADGGDPAVHHVAGGDNVGSGAGQADGGAASRSRVESLSTSKPSRVSTIMPQWPWLVYSQRQTSAMRTSFLRGCRLFERAQALLDDAVVVIRAGAALVLGLRQAEEQQAADAQAGGFLGFADGLVDGEVEDARHGADGRRTPSPGQRKRG